jgi:ABC-type sulfate/molybdate transport systems ATPase subunit
VLLDEPLAHLDPGVRSDVRETLPRELDAIGAAAIIVTHQADDVMLFGQRLLCLNGDGGWWLGTTRFAIESPPNAALAAYSERGTLLEGTADDSGHVDLGLGIGLTRRPPGRKLVAYLDATAVRLTDESDTSRAGTFVAPDLRGGCWVRVEGRLLRSAESRGGLQAGDPVKVRIVGQVRELDTEPA